MFTRFKSKKASEPPETPEAREAKNRDAQMKSLMITELPISTEYVDSLCEIKSSKNELLGTGIIGDVDEQYITVVGEENSLPTLAYRTSIKLNVFNKDLGFKVLIGMVYISSRELMKVSDVVNLLDYERRHFFRVQVKLAGALAIPMPFKEGDDFFNPEMRTVEARILDLSLNGMLVSCEEELQIDDEFDASVRLAARPCTFHCIVRRIEMTEKYGVHYGCEFIGLHDPEQRDLCMFLFQVQRQQINKKRNKLTGQ